MPQDLGVVLRMFVGLLDAIPGCEERVDATGKHVVHDIHIPLHEYPGHDN